MIKNTCFDTILEFSLQNISGHYKFFTGCKRRREDISTSVKTEITVTCKQSSVSVSYSVGKNGPPKLGAKIGMMT
jgi:hypothetical protein